jgi:succinate dehydrogenase / fumarate reductase flavoprotein subunit
MQGLADGYFILPYTIGDYLSKEITSPKVNTNTAEFEEAEKAVKAKVEKLFSIKGKKTVDELHKELGHIMWDLVGMARNEKGLEQAIERIKALRNEFWTNVYVPGTNSSFNPEIEKALRLADFLELGEVMAYDAYNRNESCGGHFREEFQTEEGEAQRDDANYTYVACWEYTGEGQKPELNKEPLNFEFIKVAQRNYKE